MWCVSQITNLCCDYYEVSIFSQPTKAAQLFLVAEFFWDFIYMYLYVYISYIVLHCFMLWWLILIKYMWTLASWNKIEKFKFRFYYLKFLFFFCWAELRKRILWLKKNNIWKKNSIACTELFQIIQVRLKQKKPLWQ